MRLTLRAWCGGFLNIKISNMQPKLYKQMPTDEVVLCDANGDCVEARGENGMMLAGTAALLLLLIGVGYVWKKLA